MVRAVATIDGDAVGTWSMRRDGERLEIGIEHFSPPSQSLAEAFRAEAADVARFLRLAFRSLRLEVVEPASGPDGHLGDLYVVEPARGQGHADELIAAVADVARRHGAPLVSWQTMHSNHRARAVYDRLGGDRRR